MLIITEKVFRALSSRTGHDKSGSYSKPYKNLCFTGLFKNFESSMFFFAGELGSSEIFKKCLETCVLLLKRITV